MIKTAIQAAIIMIILDRLGLIGGEPWLEARNQRCCPAQHSGESCLEETIAAGQGRVFFAESERVAVRGSLSASQVHLDTLSVQATLFHGRVTGWRDNLRSYLQFISRIEAK